MDIKHVTVWVEDENGDERELEIGATYTIDTDGEIFDLRIWEAFEHVFIGSGTEFITVDFDIADIPEEALVKVREQVREVF